MGFWLLGLQGNPKTQNAVFFIVSTRILIVHGNPYGINKEVHLGVLGFGVVGNPKTNNDVCLFGLIRILIEITLAIIFKVLAIILGATRQFIFVGLGCGVVGKPQNPKLCLLYCFNNEYFCFLFLVKSP